MKLSRAFFFAVLNTLIISSGLYSQTDREQISAIRNASNTALKSYDTSEVLSFLSDDVLTTTGNGVLLCGKEELAEYIAGQQQSKMYWRRDSKEIRVNENRGLAWESGVWNAFDPEKSKQPIINGLYSAMWAKESGIWKIKSQLFVTMDEQ